MLESLVDFQGVKIGQKVVFLAKSTGEYKATDHEETPSGGLFPSQGQLGVKGYGSVINTDQ